MYSLSEKQEVVVEHVHVFKHLLNESKPALHRCEINPCGYQKLIAKKLKLKSIKMTAFECLQAQYSKCACVSNILIVTPYL